MITLQKIEHAVASVAHDIVKIARAVVPVLQESARARRPPSRPSRL